MSYSPAFSQAIEILISIEMKSREDCNVVYLSIPKIAEGLSIPVPSVKRLVSMLKKSGLISSKIGMTGGLVLTRRIDEIRLYDVLFAVEGQRPLFQIYEGFDVETFQSKEEVIPMIMRTKGILQEIDDAMVTALKAKTLADLF